MVRKEVFRQAMMANETKYSIVVKADLDEMLTFLGPEPMRFAPDKPERSIEEQLDQLNPEQRECFDFVIDHWEDKYPDICLADELTLRYCRNSHGEPFSTRTTWKALRKLKGDKNTILALLDLKANNLMEQLSTKTLFPVPGLQTKHRQLEVFYMKPSRYVPKTTPVKAVIENLAYVINCMLEKESCCTNGIAFIANMNDWEMGKHFSTNYCFSFMQMLQGNQIPVRVESFLIVNPKPWFDKVWKMMRPMLSEEFAQKVHMIPEIQLEEHFETGFEDYLPDEFKIGRASTIDMASDFLTYRLFLEGSKPPKVPSSTPQSPYRGKTEDLRILSPHSPRRNLSPHRIQSPQKSKNKEPLSVFARSPFKFLSPRKKVSKTPLGLPQSPRKSPSKSKNKAPPSLPQSPRKSPHKKKIKVPLSLPSYITK